ncbi:hypothetical protein N657DRAFT_10555 [Parathielavia appendiculata]|uniref:Uncharacterized protein n=1 Tax=Parathielavia appendiculata TaxID=2587402 RepID=A0AAN6U8U9_9PEZI|nr:hypothetical protein N657DRAFT_10555 [Parathielavia appendiculata]
MVKNQRPRPDLGPRQILGLLGIRRRPHPSPSRPSTIDLAFSLFACLESSWQCRLRNIISKARRKATAIQGPTLSILSRRTLARRRSRATIRPKAKCSISSSRRLRSRAAAVMGVSKAVWRRCAVALSVRRAASAARNAANVAWTARHTQDFIALMYGISVPSSSNIFLTLRLGCELDVLHSVHVRIWDIPSDHPGR